jgi:hypothetical protein
MPRLHPAPGAAGAATDAECSDHTEGADYARALLERIGKGASSPAELATLLQFLHAGSMLHGACAVLFVALAATRPGRAER